MNNHFKNLGSKLLAFTALHIKALLQLLSLFYIYYYWGNLINSLQVGISSTGNVEFLQNENLHVVFYKKYTKHKRNPCNG